MMNICKYLFMFFILFITSCMDKPAPSVQGDKPESTGEIVDKYVNTLTTAQDKAKKASAESNAQIERENQAAREIDKQ